MLDLTKLIKNNIWKIVAALMLAFLLYTADISKVIGAISDARIEFVALAAICSLMNVLLWVLSWRRMFSLAGVSYSIRKMFRLYTSARFVNLVTPLGHFGGGPIMAVVVSQNTKAEYGRSLSAILTANILVAFPLLLFSIAGYMYLLLTNALSSRLSGMFFALLFIIGIAVFFLSLAWFSPKKFKKFVRIFITPFILFEDYIYNFNIKDKAFKFEEDVLGALSDMRGNNNQLLYSILIVSVAVFWRILSLKLVLIATGIQLNIFVLALLIPLLSLANYGPTPGGSGVVEAAMVGLLVLFTNVSVSLALAAAIIYRLSTYYLEVSLGCLSMSTLDSVDFEEREFSSTVNN